MEDDGITEQHNSNNKRSSTAGNLNPGDFIETNLAIQSIISSDKPILVSQYSNGSSWDGVTSDPFMMFIPPFEQFLANYTLSTSTTTRETTSM